MIHFPSVAKPPLFFVCVPKKKFMSSDSSQENSWLLSKVTIKVGQLDKTFGNKGRRGLDFQNKMHSKRQNMMATEKHCGFILTSSKQQRKHSSLLW
jgi:hypothetical protein